MHPTRSHKSMVYIDMFKKEEKTTREKEAENKTAMTPSY